MKRYQTNINNIACAVHVDHKWSLADIVLILGTAEDNETYSLLAISPSCRPYSTSVRSGLPRMTLCEPVRPRTATESTKADKVVYLHQSDTVVL